MSPFDQLSHDEQLACLHDLAKQATDRYAIPSSPQIELINLSENATYAIECRSTARKWALRVHREGYHSRNAIASELAWLIDLRKSGVVITPRPVKGKDGELIQTVAHPLMSRPRNVVLFDWETGSEPGIGDEDLAGPFENLGEVTARMHLHSRQWRRPPGFERLTWDFETSIGLTPHWGR